AGVDGEVDQHLLELPWIGVDQSEIRVEMRRERNILTNEAAEHLLHVGNDGVNTHRADLKNLFPAEREELARECRGSSRRVAYFLNVGPYIFGRADVGQEHRAVIHDHSQQIVEIMGDAAGELTD